MILLLKEFQLKEIRLLKKSKVEQFRQRENSKSLQIIGIFWNHNVRDGKSGFIWNAF